LKKSLYRQVMFVMSSICLILLITIAVKIGVFSELTSCVWIESILSVINNSYFSGVLCSIIAVIVIYFFQVQYSKRMLKKDVRCNEIIQDVYDGFIFPLSILLRYSLVIPEATASLPCEIP
jgi:membrane protein insertase Oxa1/YidC/SpoIIIJ